jgi:LPXTG-motif cell wall-anchored protein
VTLVGDRGRLRDVSGHPDTGASKAKARSAGTWGRKSEGVTMGRRMRVLVAVVAVLSLGVLAAPATAQEGFTLEECVVALAANSGAELSDAQLDELRALNVTGSTPAKPLFDTLFDGPDDPEFVVDDDVTLGEICSIYGVDVLPIQFERDDNGNGVNGVDVGEGVPPTQVLGVQQERRLPITGTDAIIIALVGLGLFGLGYLALRRTRDQGA